MTPDATAIGAGLEPVRDARPIPPGERIHIVGVGGAGASAAAIVANGAGAVVSGCDRGGPSPYTDALVALGLATEWAHDARHVTTPPRPDRLAVTKALTAIDPDHPELGAGRAAGIPVEAWQQVIADAAVGRTLLAVAGTHGKSTTAGWLVHVLVAAGLDPAAFVGALLPPSVTGGPTATGRWGRGRPFVVEADEYAGNFDAYRADIAVLTNAEWDHPDVFPDRDAVVEAFVRWLRRASDGATVVVNVADPGGSAIAATLVERPVRVVATALLHETTDDDALAGGAAALQEGFRSASGPAAAILGRIVEQTPDTTTLIVVGIEHGGVPRQVRIRAAGRHNAANALGVAGAAAAAGVTADRIVSGLESFAGVGRRLERKGEADGVVVYDDYGHHPTAIRATIEAVRQREPGRRVWAVYEPLTYHRTAALLPEFAAALATADAVAIADIWAGRDRDITIASAAGLAEAVGRTGRDIPVGAPGSVEATTAWLANEVRPGDVVLVMGGGHSYRIATGLLGRLEGSEAERA